MQETEQSEKYAEMSQRYISQADKEFQKGDLSQASNKAWGASAMALKAISGKQRGWNHSKHGLLYDVSGQMADELGRPDLRIMFRSANAMHQNYYEDWMAADEVRDGIENAREYLAGVGRGYGRRYLICVRARDGGAGGAFAAAYWRLGQRLSSCRGRSTTR